MFGKLLSGLAGVVGEVIGGVAKGLSEDIKQTSGAGHVGRASIMRCGVCGSSIPRGAQVCPACREQPNCYLNKTYK